MTRLTYPLYLMAGLLMLLASSCGGSLPRKFDEAKSAVRIYPDYAGVTIPCNIAPMNFRIETKADRYITHLYTAKDSKGIIAEGQTLDIPVKAWHRLVGNAKGETLCIDIYTESGGKWTKWLTIKNPVADSIDPYISYRLIEPSYIAFETMAICQRNLENFDEKEIYNSLAESTEMDGQCINCHSYQAYNKDGNMQMHVRVTEPGTVIRHNGEIKKINLKTPGTVSAGVYPSWHPTLPLIAYSTNTTTQSFQTRDRNKVEVQDAESDLILYEVENDRISKISAENTELETFPYWHPDGKSLWYVSAHIPAMTHKEMEEYQSEHGREIRYDLYRRPFDEKTLTFGAADTVYKASALGKSVTLPRPSPDGKWLLFTQGGFGTFHIWHSDADLYLMNVSTGEVRPLTEVNSDNVESYHSWSSSGRWIIFSSRRDDGSYTRPYIAYFGPDGKAGKPFRLPQRTPDFDDERMKSYNIPEFMVKPVEVSKAELVSTIRKEPKQVSLKK